MTGSSGGMVIQRLWGMKAEAAVEKTNLLMHFICGYNIDYRGCQHPTTSYLR